MAKLRSPNYPNRNLESALGLAQEIYAKDGRNKISRIVLANHLNHDALTGPALGKIGALRAYGLIEGTGDELRVSEDAIAALMAPLGSDARRQAIRRLAVTPTLFQDIKEEFPGKVSIESLTYWLIKNGFQPKAAPIAARAYFETMEFAGGAQDGHNTGSEPLVREPDHLPHTLALAAPAPLPEVPKQQGVSVMSGERVAFTEEGQPGQYLKLIASGDLDDGLLEALEDFVKRQRKRLAFLQRPAGQAARPEWADKTFSPGEVVPADGQYDAAHIGHLGSGRQEYSKGQRFYTCNECVGGTVRYTPA